MRCPSCGYENKETSKFCIKCGFKLSAAVTAPTVAFVSDPITPENTSDLSTKFLSEAVLIFKDVNKEFILPMQPVINVGRSDSRINHKPDIDLTSIDAEKVTSRKHARIAYSNGIYKLADLSSLNGTYVNGKKLQNGDECGLKDGDEIIFGKLYCVFNCRK